MNYCSIDDAWNSTSYVSDQFKLYENPYNTKNIETFTSEFNNTNINNNNNNTNIKYSINENDEFLNNNTIGESTPKILLCDEFMEHLNHCKSCRLKMRRKFGSKLLDRFENLCFDNKDNILLFLVALFLLILFKLLASIFI